MSYHKLKKAPAREINILMEAMNEIRADQEKQMKDSQKKNSGGKIGF